MKCGCPLCRQREEVGREAVFIVSCFAAALQRASIGRRTVEDLEQLLARARELGMLEVK